MTSSSSSSSSNIEANSTSPQSKRRYLCEVDLLRLCAANINTHTNMHTNTYGGGGGGDAGAMLSDVCVRFVRNASPTELQLHRIEVQLAPPNFTPPLITPLTTHISAININNSNNGGEAAVAGASPPTPPCSPSLSFYESNSNTNNSNTNNSNTNNSSHAVASSSSCSAKQLLLAKLDSFSGASATNETELTTHHKLSQVIHILKEIKAGVGVPKTAVSEQQTLEKLSDNLLKKIDERLHEFQCKIDQRLDAINKRLDLWESRCPPVDSDKSASSTSTS